MDGALPRVPGETRHGFASGGVHGYAGAFQPTRLALRRFSFPSPLLTDTGFGASFPERVRLSDDVSPLSVLRLRSWMCHHTPAERGYLSGGRRGSEMRVGYDCVLPFVLSRLVHNRIW